MFRVSRFLVVSAISAIVAAGCAALDVNETELITPDTIAFENIDMRQMDVQGRFSLRQQRAHVKILASSSDTLIWIDSQTDGGFQQALLRRGNTVYTLAHEGDYRRGSTTQSILYQRIMAFWHSLSLEEHAPRLDRPRISEE